MAAAERRAQQEADRIEQQRLAKEREQQDEERRKREAEERRAADVGHRRAINRAAVLALVEAGLDESDAAAVITAIAKGLIPAVSINY
ncbi:hypothetical protein EYR03_08770 [Xanthomonas oryzae pv. oryzae]|uniref:hypothetical protein n=1 Tax=Xanthomonas oryzae TaxID=347 RepID=UPI001035F487|nr:hypothetical protein [Xanthomonas oryzae]QBI15723.1 hypothetical protein EYR03_08770 [Xanthomonas oryzae pv. oryzae]